VYAFDIQEQALQLTRDRLDKEPPGTLAEVTLHHQSHALMGECVPKYEHGRMGAIMFNLGYLPADSSDKRIMTETASTLTALEAAIELLRPGGIITIVLYPGHKGGDAGLGSGIAPAQSANDIISWSSAFRSAISHCTGTEEADMI
jgi:hypothetical protein